MVSKRYALLLASVCLLAAVATGIRSQNTAPLPSARQSAETQADVPIAEFNAPEPADPDKRAKRQARAKRHNLRDKQLSPEVAARVALSESDSPAAPPPAANKKSTLSPPPTFAGRRHEYQPPVIAGAVSDESPPEQPLPTHVSDAVVIGDVTDATAYLSEDKTSVYSEFRVRVGEVLKNSPSWPMSASVDLEVLRPGGAVRFPSGNVRRMLVGGRGLPRAGGRYALFLKYDEAAQSFYIVTGYELRGGKVFPLDGLPRYATEHHPLAPYVKYVNADEGTFLEAVRQAVINPPQDSPGGFPISPTTPEEGV